MDKYDDLIVCPDCRGTGEDDYFGGMCRLCKGKGKGKVTRAQEDEARLQAEYQAERRLGA